MEIKVNGKPVEVSSNTTVADLVNKLNPDNKTGAGTAVAIDGVIIPKIQWSGKEIKPDNDVILIKAAYGG